MYGAMTLSQIASGNYVTDFSRDIVMQFTGLFDKNSKEIYEGDIVRQQNQNEFGSFTESLGEVAWCEAHLGFEVRSKNYSPEIGANTLGVNCWVVGNIHENADLLK